MINMNFYEVLKVEETTKNRNLSILFANSIINCKKQ